MNIVTRALWNAANPTRITPFNSPAREVYVHHGASAFPVDIGDRDGDGVPDGEEALVREYQRFHFGKGWSDIAYNWLIGPSGNVYEGRGWDRVGGGTGSPQDSYSMSICALGNYEQREPTKAMVQAYIDLIVDGIRKGKLTADVQIFGDRDVNSTACPGKHLYAMLDDIRAGVAAELTQPNGEDTDMRPFEDIANGWRAFNQDEEWAIRLTQEMLRAAGYRPGAPDGKKRPMLFDALEEFGAGDDPTKIGPPAWRRLVAAAVEFKCPEVPRQTGSQAIDDLTAENADLKRKLEVSHALNVEQARRISAGIDALGGAVRA